MTQGVIQVCCDKGLAKASGRDEGEEGSGLRAVMNEGSSGLASPAALVTSTPRD